MFVEKKFLGIDLTTPNGGVNTLGKEAQNIAVCDKPCELVRTRVALTDFSRHLRPINFAKKCTGAPTLICDCGTTP